MRRIAVAVLATVFSAGVARADTVKIPRNVNEAGMKAAKCSVDPKEIDEDLDAHELTGRLKLVGVYCWRAAYQGGSVYFIIELAALDKARLMQFLIWSTSKKRLVQTCSEISYRFIASHSDR